MQVDDEVEGIAAKHLPLVPEQPCRADDGWARSHGGTAPGLAIFKSITESHGGQGVHRDGQGVHRFFSGQGYTGSFRLARPQAAP